MEEGYISVTTPQNVGNEPCARETPDIVLKIDQGNIIISLLINYSIAKLFFGKRLNQLLQYTSEGGRS